ncbi:MAG: hypothetical protein P4L27_10755 [Ignavibacteriaceae bacterium]|nr:hypothetical protein [Ignavibacteriaceae bacterium]
MKLQLLIALLFSIFIIGCAGSYKSSVTPGYDPPKSTEIAIIYLDYPDVNISSIATKVLQENLKRCRLYDFLSAEKTEDLLQKNNITIPKRFTKTFIQNLKGLLNVKYLLTGGVTMWKEGSAGYPIASSTEFGASLTMYDLESGEVVWAVSGESTGGSGIFSDPPDAKAYEVFRGMLKKWDGFCK